MTSIDPNPERRLDQALAALPRTIEPDRDLWTAIESRLERRRTVLTWPVALAAGVALIAMTALMTLLVTDARHPPGRSTATADQPAALSGGGALAQAKLAATRSELKRAFAERLTSLAPETRTAVLRSLATIQDAHRELEQALAADPSSTLVRDLLYATSEQEYSLYQDIVGSANTFNLRT